MQTPIEINCVAIISPGDMGHAIGRELLKHGCDVVACLERRSSRTQTLCRDAGIRNVASLEDLVTQADLVLSILAPANAMEAAKGVSAAIAKTNAKILFADCNAVSISTVKSIGQEIRSAGGQFVDASIIGFPPGKAAPPRLYVSGPDCDRLTCLHEKGIQVIPLGQAIGQASGIKMCYAALTKGTFALQFALSMVAQKLGLFEQLCAEFEHSQRRVLEQMQVQLPALPAKSARWIGEMEEIASTFASVGVTSGFHEGAADVYRVISQSPLGNETPESIDLGRTLAETIAAITEF